MGKLAENAWIDGVGYGPGFGDRQPPGSDEPVESTEPPAGTPMTPAELAANGLDADSNPIDPLADLDKDGLLALVDEQDPPLDVNRKLGATKLRAEVREALDARYLAATPAAPTE